MQTDGFLAALDITLPPILYLHGGGYSYTEYVGHLIQVTLCDILSCTSPPWIGLRKKGATTKMDCAAFVDRPPVPNGDAVEAVEGRH